MNKSTKAEPQNFENLLIRLLESINKIYLNLQEIFLHIDKDADRYVNNRYSIKLSYVSLKKI